MNPFSNQLFVCFAAKDRYDVAEPVVYHLKNYGIEVWYDRQELLLGDNRQEKNLNEGAGKSKYAMAILSKNTANSVCAMEELSIIESRLCQNKVTVFPVLYELSPSDIPPALQWVKGLIFKEVDRRSGTREICNHIACKVTGDLVDSCSHRSIQAIVSSNLSSLPPAVKALLSSYQKIDSANLNSRIALLYAAYIANRFAQFGYPASHDPPAPIKREMRWSSAC